MREGRRSDRPCERGRAHPGPAPAGRGTAVGPDGGRCPACAAGPAPPSASALFRLTRFARARARMIVLGFVLTLASTGASLIPALLLNALLQAIGSAYVALILTKTYTDAAFGTRRW